MSSLSRWEGAGVRGRPAFMTAKISTFWTLLYLSYLLYTGPTKDKKLLFRASKGFFGGHSGLDYPLFFSLHDSAGPAMAHQPRDSNRDAINFNQLQKDSNYAFWEENFFVKKFPPKSTFKKLFMFYG